ncbi:MAG: insulinase family protein [Muribaculaceae bacterium]|nr:insulinase family protein [Muribaculaceae bacterium]
MIKKILTVVMMLMAVVCGSAQTPLPLNPKVRHGVLPNGLTYYIMHNEMPKERANFYIAQKVGSTLEEQDQLGLAHFLEHMAFNGTKNYPGKNMLNYLQSKGIRFGADINAYTSFDETVYNINNVPTTDKPLMDSVLLVLRDWSGDILLEDAEIEAERGVIQEEWRSRTNASLRMYTKMLPKIYEEYQYHQMPIGSMEVVMNFKPEVLRAYYKKWYRPDQQGIIIVGDFDAEEMENKVKAMFSSIPMPENAAERKYPTVSDNKEPIYFGYTDPEVTSSRTTISFKEEKVPFELRNTVEILVQYDLVREILSSLINNRLQENAVNPSCLYSGAGCYFGDFYVSKTKSSFNVVTIAKKGTQGAVAEVMGIVARACKTGFTETELNRIKEELLSQLENRYKERDKTDNNAYGSELCSTFVDNEPNPGIEKEYELLQQVLPLIEVGMINQYAAKILTSDNIVIVTSEPEKEGFQLVAEDVLVKTIKDAMNAQYEAFVDEVVSEPLIAKLPKPGKVKKIEENKDLGFKTYTLSNDVKVIVKTTDFAADEVLLSAFREGGKRSYKESDAANVRMLSTAYSTSRKGPFDAKQLRKYLSGKQANLTYSTTTSLDMLGGESTVKDLPVLMELIYTSFTALNPDDTTYNVAKENMAERLKNAFQNPQMIFSSHVSKARYGGNPLMETMTPDVVESANYSRMLEMIKASLRNAADYTFVFTGNIEDATFVPLLEQYIATLPVAKVKKEDIITPIETPKGEITDSFKQPMTTPSTSVFTLLSGDNLDINLRNEVMIGLLGSILDDIYIATLREEEGGTYGAHVSGFLNYYNKTWNLIYTFQTNADQQDKLMERAQSELSKLLNEGAQTVNFTKAKEAMIKQQEIQSKKTSYWDDGLVDYLRGFDMISDHKGTIEKITLDDLNGWMKNLYNGKNKIQVIMEGVPVEK